MKRFIPVVAIFVLLALLLVLVAPFTVNAVGETWESYKTSARTTVWGSTYEERYNASFYTAFMEGTGYASGTYKIGYYDGAGTFVAAEIQTVADSTLQSSYALNSDPSATAWLWHSVVFSITGNISDNYTAAKDDPNYVVDDNFLVGAAAIPEFPTVFAMVIAVGLCFGIYFWMRRNYHRQLIRA